MPLSLCNQCLSHVSAHPTETTCPFCDAPLEQATPRASSASIFKGRGANLAAALGVSVMLTTAGVVGCQKNVAMYGGPPVEYEEPPKTEDTNADDMATDAGNEDDMGSEPDSSSALREANVQPASPGVSIYGGPPSEDDGPQALPEPE